MYVRDKKMYYTVCDDSPNFSFQAIPQESLLMSLFKILSLTGRKVLLLQRRCSLLGRTIVKGTKQIIAKLPGPLPCCIFSCFFLLLPLLFNPCLLLLPLHQQLLHAGLPLRFQGSLALLGGKRELTALSGMEHTAIERNCTWTPAEPKRNPKVHLVVPCRNRALVPALPRPVPASPPACAGAPPAARSSAAHTPWACSAHRASCSELPRCL